MKGEQSVPDKRNKNFGLENMRFLFLHIKIARFSVEIRYHKYVFGALSQHLYFLSMLRFLGHGMACLLNQINENTLQIQSLNCKTSCNKYIIPWLDYFVN